jgi:hypothetical protein
VRDQKREFIKKSPKERKLAKPRGALGNGAGVSMTGAPEIGGPQGSKGVAASLRPSAPIPQFGAPSNVGSQNNAAGPSPQGISALDAYLIKNNPALAKLMGLPVPDAPTTMNLPVAPKKTAPEVKRGAAGNVVPPSQRANSIPMALPTVPLPARPASTIPSAPSLTTSAPASKRGADRNVVPPSQRANTGPVARSMAPVSTLPYYVVAPSKQANTRPVALPVAPLMAPISARPSYLGPGGPPLPPTRYSEDVIQKYLTHDTMFYPGHEAEDMANSRRIHAAPIARTDDAPRVKQVKRDKDVETVKQVKRDEDVDMEIDAGMDSMTIDHTERLATQMPATGDTDMDVENAPEADFPMLTYGQDIIWGDDEPVNTDDVDMGGTGKGGHVQPGPGGMMTRD